MQKKNIETQLAEVVAILAKHQHQIDWASCRIRHFQQVKNALLLELQGLESEKMEQVRNSRNEAPTAPMPNFSDCQIENQ